MDTKHQQIADNKVVDQEKLKDENPDVKDKIQHTRNVDSEAQKQRVTPQAKDKPPASKPPLPPPPSERPTPPKTEGAANAILELFLRSPLTGSPRQGTSTFTPNAHMMYYILNCMDTNICNSFYFRRNGVFWHPFVSRICTSGI